MTTSRALHTDLYQLTMIVGYLKRQMAHTPVVCEAFVRRLPAGRSFLLVAGLQQIVDYLHGLCFTAEQLDYLRDLPVFTNAIDDATYHRLLTLRFTGDLWALPEGTVAFANEPLLRVEAPLWQAQLVETFLLSTLNHATLVASKAARIVAAARDAGVMEFGTRRTHAAAAVSAARAAYIAGCIGSSNVEAGFRYGIPCYGTVSHMWTMAHDTEPAAFQDYLRVYPEQSTLLVDTYDTLDGTRRACQAARRTGDPRSLAGVRIDSNLFDPQGRPSGICRQVRQILDGEGFEHTRIIVSDDMNEQRITALLRAGEPINTFGVGTELVTSKDAPALGGVYKVVWVGEGAAGHPVSKLSPGKVTYPGAHQIWRQHDSSGTIVRDLLGLADERLPGTPLLQQVMAHGELTVSAARLGDLQRPRARAREQIASLPANSVLGDTPALTVEPSERLQELIDRTQARLANQKGP